MGDELDLRALFAEEARGQLGRLADGALELERGATGTELVAQLFRDAHTLKSSAGLVGLPVLGGVAHDLEEVLGQLRAGTRSPSPELADVVLACVDALGTLVEAGLAGREAPEAAAAARTALAGLDGDVAAAPPAPTSTATVGDTYATPELRALFAEEAAGQLRSLAEAALDLEDAAAPAERVGRLLRGVHSLKGSAALVGLHPVADLAHALEAVLGEVRDGTRAADRALVDALLRALDALRAAAEAAGAGGDALAPLAAGHEALRTLAATATTSPPPEPAAAPAPAAPRDELVPVGLERLDRLVRLSGEAVAAESRLSHLLTGPLADDPDAEAAMTALRRVLRGLQDEVLATRMTSLAVIAGPLRRAVRDVARGAGKEVDYRLQGERVQLDRAVLDGLRDPLLHLVRNAVDHGLEAPDARRAAGKPTTGTVVVRAERRGREVVVTVADDGAGLDLDALRRKAGEPELADGPAAELIFRAGLSTAAAVTDVSGRGVGMDAVRAGVEALRGRVGVETVRGRGTTFSLTVPLTLAVVPCVLVRAGTERYALPTSATLALSDVPRAAELGVDGGAAVWHGDRVVPVGVLADVLGAPGAEADRDGAALVLQGSSGGPQALRVGAVLGQRDVTVRELGAVLPRTDLVAGASLEADGSVVCVLDAAAVVDAARRSRRGRPEPAAPAATNGSPAAPAPPRPPAHASVLVVDDALTVRELERSILERAGYAVRTAVDGEDALARLAEERPDLVVCDVEMPRMDGHALVRRLRTTPSLRSVPVLMVTSRGTEEDRRAGLEAGADAYLVKRDVDEERLLGAVRRLLGT